MHLGVGLRQLQTDRDSETHTSTDKTVDTIGSYVDVVDILARGRFGEVKRCRERSTGAEFAAKFIATSDARDHQDAVNEISIMLRLRPCRRLVQLYDVFETKNITCLVLEVCVCLGSLFCHISDMTTDCLELSYVTS